MKNARIFAFLLAVLLLLAGCSVTPDITTTGVPSTSVAPSVPATLPAEIVIQTLPAEVENPDGLPVLKWVCLVDDIYGGGKRSWNEAAVHELNEMLAQRGASFRLQFVMLTSPDMVYADWLLRSEALKEIADADLIYGLMTTNQMRQYLAPITDYIDGTKSTALANLAIHPHSWVNGTTGGEIYGIPTRPVLANCGGWKVDPSVLRDYGLTEADFTNAYWEMDEIFSKIYESNGKEPFLYLSNEASLIFSNSLNGGGVTTYINGNLKDELSLLVDYSGSCIAIDYSSGTPKVANYLELDSVRKLQAAAARHAEAGYTTGSYATALVSYTKCRLDHVYTDADGNLIIPSGELIIDTAAAKHVSGIAATSEHQQEAVELLRLLADDQEFQTQFFYGKESRDYTLTNGSYTLVEQDDKSNYSMDFVSELSYFSGFQSIDTPEYDSPSTLSHLYWMSDDGMSALETQQRLIDNSTIWCPIDFDYTGLESEILAVSKVAEIYLPGLARMDAATYDEMLKAFENAGINKIIDTLQKQLDEWLEANPDWNK